MKLRARKWPYYIPFKFRRVFHLCDHVFRQACDTFLTNCPKRLEETYEWILQEIPKSNLIGFSSALLLPFPCFVSRIGIIKGNPGVIQADPDPDPYKTRTRTQGRGSSALGSGFV